MLTVLLATYNGAKYIRQQLNSLLNQTYEDFNILIHDDGSTDGTNAIIDEYISANPDKIAKIGGEKTGGACANFSYLLGNTQSDYIMFCDQDDVWLQGKIEITLEKMKNAEEQYGSETPILVHSDLSVVDESLKVINRSFFDFQGLGDGSADFAQLLVQNYVTGCTVMINKALKEKCGEIPKESAMHDWWLALVAAYFGKIEIVKTPLMYYRQHSGNQVGAKGSHGVGYIVRKIGKIKETRENYLKTYIQARVLRQRYIKDSADPQKQKILNAYCNMSELGKLGRIKLMRKYGFKKSTKIRRIGQYFFI